MAILFSLTKVRNHCDLLVMVLGAGAQLSSSVFLYKILTPTDYGLYSVLLTYIATVFSFGLFGLEQTFLRLCVVRDDKVYVSKYLSILLCCGLFVGPPSFAVLAKLFFLKEVSVFSLYCLSLMSAFLMFVYNFKRIAGKFIASQLVNNLWKIGILFSLLFYPYIHITFEYLIVIILIMLSLCSLFSLYSMYIKPVGILSRDSEMLGESIGLSVSFLFSMGVLTALSFFDKYLIGVKFNVDVFGEYFFLVNVFVYPFALFANYYGFRKLVEYKKSFNFEYFKKEQIALLFKVLFFGASYILTVNWLGENSLVGFDFFGFLTLIVPLGMLGGVKILYSSLSAAMGARGQRWFIFQSNLISLVIVVPLGVIVILADVGIVFIAWSMVFLWLCRCMLYFYGVSKFAGNILNYPPTS